MVDLVRTPEGYRPPQGSGSINGAVNVGGGPGEIAAGVAGDQIRERTIVSPDGSISVATVGDQVQIQANTTPVPASAGPAVFNRPGTTGNNTWLRVGQTTCAAPVIFFGGSGFPISSDGTREITAIRFRSRQGTTNPADLEIYRFQGDGFTGSSALLVTLAIPPASFEFDAAVSITIPAGAYTLGARRGAGGPAGFDRWRDVTVSLEIE